ncbi:hypothetical protein SLOPH_1816 [Spraguea lophii 42_110]|uniref:Kinetochore protein SPC25 n=1 Tax=Spraguea lophii (strain 42_110) TaxID=1358809 RepID=S7XTV7_SPRLO|nr:hypothetical protein SLOPH_1816 [Spraguea lophii 42_110]
MVRCFDKERINKRDDIIQLSNKLRINMNLLENKYFGIIIPIMTEIEKSASEILHNECNEIIHILNKKLSNIRQYHEFVKKELKKEHELNNEIKMLSFEREKLTQKCDQLIVTRNSIKSEIKKEKEEIEAVTKENNSLKEEIRKNEEKKSDLYKKYNEKRNKEKEIIEKIDSLENRNKEKNNKIKVEADLYRKHLGLDIIPLQESIIKIIFSPFETSPTITPYIIINFTQHDLITDIHPEVAPLEKVNNMFFESKNFYIFVKNIREVLKQKVGNFI